MRMWPRLEEPMDVEFVRDHEGDLWQRCRNGNWEMVMEYPEAGLPRVGGTTWGVLLFSFGPLAEVEPPPW